MDNRHPTKFTRLLNEFIEYHTDYVQGIVPKDDEKYVTLYAQLLDYDPEMWLPDSKIES